MKHNQTLSLPLVRDRGDRQQQTVLLIHSSRVIQNILDFDMGYHFTADLRETTLAPSNLDKPIFINQRNVTRPVPTVLDYFCRKIFATVVTLHHVGPFDHQHAWNRCAQVGPRIRIHDLGADTRDRSTNRAFSQIRILSIYRPAGWDVHRN